MSAAPLLPLRLIEFYLPVRVGLAIKIRDFFAANSDR